MKLSRLLFASTCLLSLAALSSFVMRGQVAWPAERVAEARMIPRNALISTEPLQPNQPPVANPDSYTVHGSLVLSPMVNDTDPDGDTILFNGVGTAPQHGTLVGVNPGQLQYTANDGYVGSDSFTYTVRDSSLVSNSTTVSITVVNQAPLANPDSFTVHGSLVLKPPLNDTDPDGDPIIFEGLVTLPQRMRMARLVFLMTIAAEFPQPRTCGDKPLATAMTPTVTARP